MPKHKPNIYLTIKGKIIKIVIILIMSSLYLPTKHSERVDGDFYKNNKIKRHILTYKNILIAVLDNLFLLDQSVNLRMYHLSNWMSDYM